MDTTQRAECQIGRFFFHAPPNNSLTQRRILKDMDITQVMRWEELYVDLNLCGIGKPPFQGMIRKSEYHIFVAMDIHPPKHIIGTMSFSSLYLMGQRFGVIYDACVTPKRRHMGVGTELLDAIIAWTRQESYQKNIPPITSLQTSFSVRLREATQFFLKQGFRRVTDDDNPFFEMEINRREVRNLD